MKEISLKELEIDLDKFVAKHNRTPFALILSTNDYYALDSEVSFIKPYVGLIEELWGIQLRPHRAKRRGRWEYV